MNFAKNLYTYVYVDLINKKFTRERKIRESKFIGWKIIKRVNDGTILI